MRTEGLLVALIILTLAGFAAAVIFAPALIPRTERDGPDPVEIAPLAVNLRYEIRDGRYLLLQTSPLEVGDNSFRVVALTENGQPVDAGNPTLTLFRLETDQPELQVPLIESGRFLYSGEQHLPEPGWWVVAVELGQEDMVTFHLRVDEASAAPLSFAGPDYQSDPAAEQIFWQTRQRFGELQYVKWREELTSGLLEPTGFGATVITEGEAADPSASRQRTVSNGFSDYVILRDGEESCLQSRGQPWQCSAGTAISFFDRGFLDPSTAFMLGRVKEIREEAARALLFHNPGQAAWYAWWIGEESGHLLREAMVAPGHFMVTDFFDHDVPVDISLPEATGSP